MSKWQSTKQAVCQQRFNHLLDDALPDPTSWIGKPEPLRYMISGA
ncbi:MAG: type II toxin-antitoxin system YoeB family toxin [Trueperella sp.]|nr:type II toxin-antitoxin system YoeB family toxin [Trueperella sp.]